MRREFDGHPDGINEPAEDDVASSPVAVTFQELFDGGGFLPFWWIGRRQRAKDFVQRVEEDAAEALASLAGALDGSNIVLYVTIKLGQRSTAEAATPGTE